MNKLPLITAMALAIAVGQPALAQQKFENLDRLDGLVAMTVGANLGEPGGPIAPIDRRLISQIEAGGVGRVRPAPIFLHRL